MSFELIQSTGTTSVDQERYEEWWSKQLDDPVDSMSIDQEQDDSLETNAKWWSQKLGELKVHVVKNVLKENGQDAMEELVKRAVINFNEKKTYSIGGAFMKILQNTPKKDGDLDSNLYAFACKGEENENEARRNQDRFRRRNRKKMLANQIV